MRGPQTVHTLDCMEVFCLEWKTDVWLANNGVFQLILLLSDHQSIYQPDIFFIALGTQFPRAKKLIKIVKL